MAGCLKNAARKGIKAWDSQIYRLENFRVDRDKLFLNFSLIPYSVRVGIKAHRDEMEKFGQDYLSKALYVSAIIETSDGKYLIGKLSGKTLNEKSIDFIGGVLSHDEIEIRSSDDLWQVMFTELDEEANIKKDDVESSSLVGGATSWYSNVALIFYVKLKIDSETVKRKFADRSDDELSDLLCVERPELEKMMRDADKSVFLKLF